MKIVVDTKPRLGENVAQRNERVLRHAMEEGNCKFRKMMGLHVAKGYSAPKEDAVFFEFNGEDVFRYDLTETFFIEPQ